MATFPWVIIDVEAIQLIVGKKWVDELESEIETLVKERRSVFTGRNHRRSHHMHLSHKMFLMSFY